MKQHAALGARIIASAELELKTASSFLRFAREIANYHHENWDGSGYPDQLVGTAIPLSARLMAVADVYDALISKRCYKPAFSHDDACEMIIAETGRKFDPVVINIFKQSAADFSAIAEQFKDSDPIPLDSVEL